MKGGSKLFVFAGVGLALVAILLFIMNPSGGDKADAGKNQQSSKVTVVQAKTDVAAHKILTVEDLVEVSVASTDAPADAAGHIADVVGQAYRIQLSAGQTIVKSQLETPGLRNDIEPGKRAMALPVDEVSALSGLIQDDDYIDIIFHARINLVRNLPTTVAIVPEDGDYVMKTPQFLPADLEQPIHPAVGDPGSEFVIRDDIGEAGQLEPVAKIMLQDVHVLRVVRPGESFLGNGSKDETISTDSKTQTAGGGQLIIEVTPDQAEMVNFLNDSHAQYQVVVRAKDDHQTVSTSGITYSILATDPDWMLPWPKTVVAPSEQASDESNSEDTGGDSSSSDSSGT